MHVSSSVGNLLELDYLLPFTNKWMHGLPCLQNYASRDNGKPAHSAGVADVLDNEVEEGLAPVDGPRQRRRRVSGDLEHGSHRVHAGQGRHAVTQLNRRDSCGIEGPLSG